MNKKKLGFGLLVVCVAILWPSGALGYLSDLWGHWSAGFVTTLEVRGIVNGDDRGLFAPDAPLTRAQLAKMLTVALGYEAEAEGLRQLPSRFRDVPAWHWARGYVELVAEACSRVPRRLFRARRAGVEGRVRPHRRPGRRPG